MNISGVVVKTTAERLAEVLESLESSGLCDVHFHDSSGQIVITMGCRDTDEEIRRMKAILDLPHVLSAGLVYSCSDPDRRTAAGGVRRTGNAVPERLRD